MALKQCAVGLGLLLALLVGAAPVQAQPPPSQAGQRLRVGFWHLRNLDDGQSQREYSRRLAQVMYGLDCIALGEAHSDRALSILVNELTILGGRWNKVKNRKPVGSVRATGERYGILYRSDKIEVRGFPATLPETWLPVRAVAGRHRLDRPPLVCSFATLDGRLDFTLMVVNVTEQRAAASHRAAEPVPQPHAYVAAEISALGTLFLQVQRREAAEQDLLLVGNFHREPGDPSFAGLLSLPGMTDLADGLAPTTIDDRHRFDHIFLQTNFVTEYTGVRGVERFDERFFGGDDEAAARVCSDHRPIWLELQVPERDDD